MGAANTSASNAATPRARSLQAIFGFLSMSIFPVAH
jgi:hypothetical protein